MNAEQGPESSVGHPFRLRPSPRPIRKVFEMARTENANTAADLDIAIAVAQAAEVIKGLSTALSFDDVALGLRRAKNEAKAMLETIEEAEKALS